MLAVSEQAQEMIKAIVEDEQLGPDAGLRITGEQDGEDTSLDLELVAAAADGDVVIEEGGARVFLDPVAAAALVDQVLAVEEHGDHMHFSFEEKPAGA